jgi:uncharacterized membrane protein
LLFSLQLTFTETRTMKRRLTFRKLFQYFLQGLIILAPIAITMYAISALFNFVDNILPDFIASIFPSWLGTDATGKPFRIPGLGFVLVVVMLVLVGFVSSSFIVGRLVDLFDKVFERTPGIKILYTPLKDFFEAFAGNKRKFDKAILVSTQGDDTWQLGFMTQENLSHFDMTDHVAVYIPKSYAFTGELFFVPRKNIRLIKGLSSTDAMKFAISGGVAELGDDQGKPL